MLINVKSSELHSDSSNGILLAIILGIAFYSTIDSTSPSATINNSIELSDPVLDETIKESSDVFVSTSDKWEGNLFPITEISSIGNIIYSSHAL